MGLLYSIKIPRLIALFFVAAISISTVGCDGNDPIFIPPVEYGLTVTMDSLWILGSSKKHQIKVEVQPKDIPQGSRVRCQISNASMFYLYDDGGVDPIGDSNGFADTLSGDSNAGDGVFTRYVTSLFTVEPGEFIFTFSLPDSIHLDTARVTLTVRANSSPTVVFYTIPDSLPSGSSGSLIEAELQDPDGLDDVAFAELFLPRQRISFPLSQVNDSTWQWLHEPYVGRGLQTDRYPVMVRAFDYAGASSQGWDQGRSDYCWIENLPPIVRNVEGPDTVYLPEEGERLFDYIVTVEDEQTALDLDELMLVMLDDSRIVFDSTYYDDGDGIDTTAGDGKYGVGFRVSANNQPDILYTFEWTPVDLVGQIGETFTTTLIFLRDEGAFGTGSRDDISITNKSKRYYRKINR